MKITQVPPRLQRFLWRFVHLCWFVVMSLALVILIASLPVYLIGWPFDPKGLYQASTETINAFRFISSLASFSCALVSLTLAGILFVRKSYDRMALFISFYLLFYGVMMGGPLEAFLFSRGLSNDLAIFIQTVLITLPTLILFSTFPNGKFIPTWTRWLVLIAIMINLFIISHPGEDWVSYSSLYAQVVGLLTVLLFIAAFYAQVYRYRRVSSPSERQQTKWAVSGLLLWMIYLTLSTYPYMLQQSIPVGQPLPWWFPLTVVSWWLSLNILPLSLTIAILRYRLFDIDVIIRRTLVYSVLTILLGLTFFGTVLLLQTVFRTISGHDSAFVIVISTLTIAALFAPLRTRVQEFIDWRFYRRKYDAEQALASFANIARDEVDMDRLADALLAAINESLQPEHTGLWISAGDSPLTSPGTKREA